MPTKHAKLSPSSSSRWIKCPGSIQLSEKLNVKQTTNRFAAEGTIAHRLAELCLQNSEKPETYIGKYITDPEHDISGKVSEEMANAVQVYTDYINSKLADRETLLDVEEWLSLEKFNIEGLEGGTADAILLNLNYLEIVDYKHGYGYVTPENNTQLLTYAYAALTKLDVSKYSLEGKVYLTIVQPRAQGEPVKTWETTMLGVLYWGDNILLPAARATLLLKPELNPSEEACRYCPASGQCSAQYKKVQKLAVNDFEDLVELPDVNTLSKERKEAVLHNSELIKNFVDSVCAQAQQEVEQGETYQGYKLVRKTTKRKFKLEADDEVFSPLAEYLSEEEMYEKKLKSISKIEKSLKQVVGNVKTVELIEELTERPEGELTLVKESDKRKAVTTAKQDFKHLNWS